MTFRSDGMFPIYANNDASSPFVGQTLPLWGAVAITVQAISAAGSAGTLYIEGTNQPTATAVWYQAAAVAVAANGTAYASFSLADQLTGMHSMRCRYVSGGTGTITIAVNIRRLAVPH